MADACVAAVAGAMTVGFIAGLLFGFVIARKE